jgi:DNA-binding NarL/FixJ family response regulator
MKILLVDDHALFTDGLKSILEQSGLFEMVRSTNRATDAIRMLRNQTFDLVLLDVDMPDRSGPEVLRDIRSEFPTLPVIMVSMHMERGIIQQVRKDGASGYVLKNAGKEEFLVAIQ